MKELFDLEVEMSEVNNAKQEKRLQKLIKDMEHNYNQNKDELHIEERNNEFEFKVNLGQKVNYGQSI